MMAPFGPPAYPLAVAGIDYGRPGSEGRLGMTRGGARAGAGRKPALLARRRDGLDDIRLLALMVVKRIELLERDPDHDPSAGELRLLAQREAARVAVNEPRAA